MKASSIFNKNLKTVSRNISYFFVLLICPVILILVTGGMLNSFDTSHISVGVYDSSGNCFSSINSQSNSDVLMRNARCYNSLESCLDDVSESKLGACLNVLEFDEYFQVEVYLDTSRKLVEYYSKQMILENFLGSQTSYVEETSGEMKGRIEIYSLALVEVRQDLYETQNDLQEQENLLVARKNSLTQIRNDFDSVYYPIKNEEPELRQLRNDLVSSNNELQGNIDSFQDNSADLNNRMNNLKTFLGPLLNDVDYNYVNSELNYILDDLNEINNALLEVEQAQNSYELISKIDLVLSIIPKLDGIHSSLEQTDSDLQTAIDKTRESKNKVAEYISKLELVTEDLDEVNQKIDTKTVRLNFKESFSENANAVLSSFPLLVSIIITFTSLILSNLFVLRQVNRPSYFRELISPTGDSSFLIADYFINMFFIFIQSVVLFVVGFFWVGIPASSVIGFALGIFLTSSLFVFLGMSLGYIIKSQSLSMLLTIFVVMLFFIVSDLLIPTPLLSPTIKFFVSLNPFILLVDILKHCIVLERPLAQTGWRFLILGFFCFCSVVGAYISKKINKRRIKE